jgi:4-amino-4-deoxy-L-arabinose transferase-like glycosyltransferase
MVAALLIVANVVRFVHLDADFPPGLTTSRALYTDEGLYSANAVNVAAGRPWYIPGELNAMINLPVVPVLQAGVFRLFGHSLIVARSLVAAMSLVLIGAAFMLTVRHSPPLSAGLVAVTLSLDFFLFSYSRLAILDVIMTAVVTLTFVTASCLRARNIALAAGFAGALLGVAALTKTTALCALPPLAYFCSAGVPDTRHQRRIAGLVLGSCAVILVGYNALAWYAYPGDYVYFHRIAEVRLAAGPLDLARNVALAVFNTVRVDPWVAVMALGSTVAVAKSSAAFRANVLVRTSAIWVWAFLVMLSITSYQPSRYFVVVLVPLVILFAVAMVQVLDLFPTRRSAATISTVLVGCLLTYNTVRIANYLRQPIYSFARMTREVGEIVNGASASRRPGVLLGTMAPSVSLESDVTAISPEYATEDLTIRIAAKCPTYLIALQGSGAGDDRVLSAYYEVEPIKEWAVFQNYFEHRPVRLSRLRPRKGFLPACHG